jgi:hypothetical protein
VLTDSELMAEENEEARDVSSSIEWRIPEEAFLSFLRVKVR